jgi:hypothetical protein
MRGSAERPNPQDDRNFIPNNERLQYNGDEMWLFQLIDGFLEELTRVGVANEKPSVHDLDIAIENGVGRNVQVDNKSCGMRFPR